MELVGNARSCQPFRFPAGAATRAAGKARARLVGIARLRGRGLAKLLVLQPVELGAFCERWYWTDSQSRHHASTAGQRVHVEGAQARLHTNSNKAALPREARGDRWPGQADHAF